MALIVLLSNALFTCIFISISNTIELQKNSHTMDVDVTRLAPRWVHMLKKTNEEADRGFQRTSQKPNAI